jgi:hypothetical protein
LPEASTDGPEASTDGEEVEGGGSPASKEAAWGSDADSDPSARAARGSQKIVTTPSAVRKINVVATTVEVRSGAEGAASGADGLEGLPFGVAATGRSINTT